MLRLGGHLVAAGQFANRESAFGAAVVLHQLSQQALDGLRRLIQPLRDLAGAERLIGHVRDRLDEGAEPGAAGIGWLSLLDDTEVFGSDLGKWL